MEPNMALEPNQLHHFILLPFMAQGHLIPMVDIARLLAKHGVIVTIFTTAVNATRFQTIVTRAMQSGLKINLCKLRFPCEEAGLPEGCENFDMIPSTDLFVNFFTAIEKLQPQFENLLQEITPQPSCIISDMCFPWTVETASKFNIPRICFHGFSCFSLLCLHNMNISNVHESVTSDSEYFIIPEFPDKIEITKAQLPLPDIVKGFCENIIKSTNLSYGVVINTFEELESAYVEKYKKIKKGKAWCIGPVSLSNKDNKDKAERGNKTSIEEFECLKWLDLWAPNSVLYVSMGSLCNLTNSQLIELGLGLEASKKPFIWVTRGGEKTKELEKWILENKFEERVKDRGLLIHGWAPQTLILSHSSIGGFLTHCGWNSTVEGISYGVPLLTWPLFADQFCNEKLAVQVLRIGVSIGVEVRMIFGQEEKIGILVKNEDVKKAVHMLMDEGEESAERRRRAKSFGEMAKRALEEGGSSFLNMKMLIQDIMQQLPHSDKHNSK